MKKIINGLRYDTDNAIEIGFSCSDCEKSDFRWWEATLYKTPRSGRFFLAGEGGAMTRFAQPCGNMTGRGSAIQPLTIDDAIFWAEKNLIAKDVENHFADQIKDA